MSDFRQHFLADSLENLTVLRRELAAELSDRRRLEAFRTVHTIKGGAQTFGLEDAARLAHELENILSANHASIDRNLLLEGVDFLKKALGEDEIAPPENFLERLRRAGRSEARTQILLTGISAEAFQSFSGTERAAALNALREGKSIYCAEAGFEVANFADEYRKLRKILCEKSEILASLPGERHKSAGRIGFRIFLASREPLEDLQAAVGDFMIEISSYACAESEAKDLFQMLAQVAVAGEAAAEKAGKEVSLIVIANNSELSAKQTKTFFDILLHLVRNAVDHAIERRGTIEIRFFEESEGFYLSVADDGRGVDLGRVRARAVEKNLIAGDAQPGTEETLALIFAPELSTAERVTETSGRGVGLDAVKAEVEKMNGKISVKMRKTTGTIFEIFVPRD